MRLEKNCLSGVRTRAEGENNFRPPPVKGSVCGKKTSYPAKVRVKFLCIRYNHACYCTHDCMEVAEFQARGCLQRQQEPLACEPCQQVNTLSEMPTPQGKWSPTHRHLAYATLTCTKPHMMTVGETSAAGFWQLPVVKHKLCLLASPTLRCRRLGIFMRSKGNALLLPCGQREPVGLTGAGDSVFS